MHLLLCQLAPQEAIEATILRALCDVQFDMQILQAMKNRGASKTSYTYREVRENNWSSFKGAPPPHLRPAPGLGQDGPEDGNDGGGKGGQGAWAGYQQGAWGGNGPYPPGPAGGQGQGWQGQPQ